MPTSAKKLCDEQLDAVYRALLSRLPLFAGHHQSLAARGLIAQRIKENGYGSLPARFPDRQSVANKIVDLFGAKNTSRVPGFAVVKGALTLVGAAGILIPVRDVVGRVVAIKIRAETPCHGNRYSYLSSKRYGGSSPGAQVHVPLFGGDRSLIRITEGELKADIATALSGILTISIPGVSNWRCGVDAIRAIGPKKVRIAFDRDLATNKDVRRCFDSLALALDAAGFALEMETWS